MPTKIALSTLNASTVDIMNVIRANASLAYQNAVPEVTQSNDIPKVGEIIVGTPAFSNEFINALLNRIAIVRVKSATFNNPYEILKKGYLEYGESVEEIFVNIAKVFEFSGEKAEARELKQYKPDVASAFHVMNWQVIYPVSISYMQLRQAFLSADGVTTLIAEIVDSVYKASYYDEYLLFKYLLIKAVASNAIHTQYVDGAAAAAYAKAFRSTSNLLPFMRKDFNLAGVMNTTPKDRQVIFMSAAFNAEFDVDVLSAAFHMDKADFMGRLFLIDDWTTFDNDRWEVIRENCNAVESVTDDELAIMQSVTAVLMDSDWFQVYDNLTQFAEKYVAAGLRWNYFLHSWKTISFSPFANAVVFKNTQTAVPTTLSFKVSDISTDESGAFTASLVPVGATASNSTVKFAKFKFVQTEELTAAGIAVHPYGGIMYDGIKKDTGTADLSLVVESNGYSYELEDAISYNATTQNYELSSTVLALGATVNFTQAS